SGVSAGSIASAGRNGASSSTMRSIVMSPTENVTLIAWLLLYVSERGTSIVPDTIGRGVRSPLDGLLTAATSGPKAVGRERRLRVADSTGRRNGMAEHLSGRLVAKRLSWPLIQLSRYGVELGL